MIDRVYVAGNSYDILHPLPKPDLYSARDRKTGKMVTLRIASERPYWLETAYDADKGK